MNLWKRLRFYFFNFYPPYFAAGIRYKKMSNDFTHFQLSMKLHWWNQNLVGTHFGGSLYSMCDPFYMLILMENLGEEYIVWDKAATIRFITPGVGKVYADFKISREEIEKIRKETDEKRKLDAFFQTKIYDAKTGKVVAELDKIVYVRRKERIKKEKNPQQAL
ncbi:MULTISPECIES: DUF4442 domain-containing protein [Leptospira]|uniref:DUF4442 domain-containing protein n=1 Tax=Leptospira TaxID=171 RepID=UPI0002929A7F|nr:MULTISPECIES: DUF4442 domain-containing protein [Leptospira]AVV79894.1 Putative thioesterase [Leptospira santarosai]EKO79127.1 putative thioesterase [Leptospira sp. Fiocruz LV3954]EMI67955.1 putative thioesterase [Leptospira sp. Fiocruz LV4135]EMO69656.1 putative thioesterase [Leptospira santarosai str. 200403458]EMP00126.1 putative thioesterase [Leptospira santarosai str. 200702252]